MKTLDEAAKEYCEKVNHRQTYIITDTFKAGAEYIKKKILQLLDDRMTSNLANEGNSTGGRYHGEMAKECLEIIDEINQL